MLLIPTVYVGLALASFVHEVCGHVLMSVAIGGGVDRLQFLWLGGGRTNVRWPNPVSVASMTAVYGAGPVATTVAGAVLLWFGLREKNGTTRWALLLMAMCAFLDGPSIVLWDGLGNGGEGDFSKAMSMLRHVPGIDADHWQVVILSIGTALLVATTALVSSALAAGAVPLNTTNVSRSKRVHRTAWAGAFACVAAAYSLVFYGGHASSISLGIRIAMSAAIAAISTTICAVVPPFRAEPRSGAISGRGILTAWLSVVIVLAVCRFVFPDGVVIGTQ